MDAVDTAAHGPHAAPHPETRQGTLEVERGMAKLTGGRGADAPPHSQADPAQAPSSQPQSLLEAQAQPQSRARAGSELAPPGRGVRAPPSSPLQPRQQPSATLSGTRVAEHDFARDDLGPATGSTGMRTDAGMGGMDRADQQGFEPDRYAFEGEPRWVG